MISSRLQCDSTRLRDLLDDRLPQKLQEELARHLESCEKCRKELEFLAAGPEWWDDAKRLLSTVVNLNDATGADNVLAPTIAARGPERLRLGFLSPSENPTSLGRLGPYEIVKVIGRGGMGIVLKGFDAALNRHVAIKVLAPQWVHSDAARRRFAREARAAAAVAHEHVIAIHAVDSANEVPYLVMPFIDGASLQEKIDRDGPLELKDILRIGVQISSGLAAAHAQGLVHRDIKPANILLENGDRPNFHVANILLENGDCPNFRANENGTVPFGAQRVLITDFGLARAVDDASFTRSCFIAGTPEYMAPEQANGEPVDHRVDLFSLGSVMYAMCAGISPFHRESTMAVLRCVCEGTPRPIREINPEIPAWLERIIARLHAKNPAQRFQTAGEVAELLSQWLAYVEQPSAHPRPRYPSSRRRVLSFSASLISRMRWVAAAVLLLAIAGLTICEITGATSLMRMLVGANRARPTADSAATSTANSTRIAETRGDRPQPSTADIDLLPAYRQSLLDKRISDLWQRLAVLYAVASADESGEITPEKLDLFRAELAQLQAELPEFRQDPQIERLMQLQTAIESLRPKTPNSSAGRGIDSSMIEVINRIEQLNEDLYGNFP